MNYVEQKRTWGRVRQEKILGRETSIFQKLDDYIFIMAFIIAPHIKILYIY